MKNIQNLTIDINKKPFQTITANVGEVASRFIKITILENNIPADLTGVTAYLYAKKVDGTKVFNSVKVEDAKQGIVLAELTSQVLAIPGLVKLTLLLTKNGAKLASKQIIVTVDESSIDEEAIQSSNEFNALTDALKKVNNVDKKADKTYVDTLVSSVASGSPKGVYDTLNSLQSAKPNGDNNIYITSDNGCWNYWNGSAWVNGGVYQGIGLSNNSVDQHHIYGGVTSKNLYKREDVIQGQFVNVENEISNAPNTSYVKMAVLPNTNYIIGRNVGPGYSQASSITEGDPFVIFDSSNNDVLYGRLGNYYKGTDSEGLRYAIVTTPSNASYIGFNIKVNGFDSIEKTYVYKLDDVGEYFTSLEGVAGIDGIFGHSLVDTSIRSDLKAFRDSIKDMSNDIYLKNVLLFNNSYVNIDGVSSSATGWKRAVVPVKPNTKYWLYFPSQVYTNARGVVSFLGDNNKFLSFMRFDEMEYIHIARGESCVLFTTPLDCTRISFSVTAGESQQYSFDDSSTTIITENTMVETDLKHIVREIDNMPVFTQYSINDYIKLPTFNSTWDVNLLHHSDTIFRDNTLYNNVGMRNASNGWMCADLPVEGGTTYYFYSPSKIYDSGVRGAIVLMNSEYKILQIIENQNKNLYLDTLGNRWQIIKTTSDTSYIGITIKRPNLTFDDKEKGIVLGHIPTDGDMVPYITKINGWEIQASNVPTLTTSWDENILKNNDDIISRADTLYNNNAIRQNASGWMTMDIPVKGGETYYFYSPSKVYDLGSRGAMVLLDSELNIIQAIEGQNTNTYTPAGTSDKWQVINTTSDTYAIGITILGGNGKYDDRGVSALVSSLPNSNSSKEVLTAINGFSIGVETSKIENNYPLKGQKWVVVGDSLTEFNIRATKNYHDYVAEDTGVTVVNMGKSGTGYKKREEEGNAFYQRIANIPTDADIITFFGSGNDLSLTLGTPSDTGTDTICGCMHQTFKNLFEIMPGAKVGVVLPCPWGAYPPSNKTNKMALYSEALKEIASQYSIPVLDLYHGSNLRPWDNTFKELYYKRDNGGSVHPDEDGHKILANKFKMFIQSL